MNVENMTEKWSCSLFVFKHYGAMRRNKLRQQVETVSVRKGDGVTEVNWTIACGSEIKQDAGLWQRAQISPVQYLDERTSAYFADFCSRPHGNLSSSPE